MCSVNGPLLVVISGLPGTGKSALATALAERIGAITLSRDQARQEISGRLAGADRVFTRLAGRPPPGLQRQAGRRLLAAAACHLAHGYPVIVEVVATPAIRRQLAAVAGKRHAPVYPIEVVCSDTAEHAQRLRARPGNWQRIVTSMSRTYQPANGALVLDSRNAPAQMAERAAEFICSQDS
jgi:predicted kinase